MNKDTFATPSRRDMLRLGGLTALGGVAAAAGIGGLAAPALAQKGQYDTGADDREVRIGQTLPFSGPASYIGVSGRVQLAYFERLNKKGGVNGRQVRLIALDDAYSPPKTVEATRRLIESEHVLGTFGSIGTACQAAVQRYMNSRKIPQLMIGTGAARFNNPREFPWTTPGSALYSTEARVLARHLLATKPDARIAILHQVDELGRDYLTAFREELGDRAKTMIVAEASYEVADPTADSQVLKLASTNASVFLNLTVGKFVSQSLRKVQETGWRPDQYLLSGSATISLLKPAGKGGEGALALRSVRSISSPRWKNDPAVIDYFSLLDAHLPNLDRTDNLGFAGYSMANVLHQMLERCGDNLTRDNLLKVATNLTDMTAPINLPGVNFSTTPEDYAPLRNYELSRYENDDWTGIKVLS
ncbi:ABC transporter substrate-binding protein [Camelimonas lactis]|uniref:ABC-type branched-subunit amino acid transport system substrate-binding protein n=1 Tax=Camelimonas lactis TaxID=659006 RepID=A0A4R2GYB7_9HYPH|nr:ABC transporter substrate-binding protein [Camelimonas lactis]TCO16280.1 ABC-type branched-subunit amino acid transport system substrate-binding protein [Camelimonas lactis]